MPDRNPAFTKIDDILPQVSLEQVAAFYGVLLPELKRTGVETRSRCFLLCGRVEETGPRALAIQEGHPAKQWACHQYGCGKSGNLASICDLLKPGPNMGGRARGDRFKEILADLRAMVSGEIGAVTQPRPAPVVIPAKRPTFNLPLAESENERARGLLNLDAKFTVDPATMSPPAASYFRRRPFLSPEACRKWRMGYLARDTGGEDKSGGTMRGKVVYGYPDEDGNVLTWFGRDPAYEEKRREWDASDKKGREPEKFHFVKGFHRGLELFGQHFLSEAETLEKVERLGIIVVEGPNDVIALDALGVPAVGLCSNLITGTQVEKIAWLAREMALDRVTLLLDCDPAGESGAKQALWELAKHSRVRLGWSSEMFEGRFKDRQPESLTAEEWQVIAGRF